MPRVWLLFLSCFIALTYASPARAQLSEPILGDRVVAAVRHCPTVGIFDDVTIGVRERTVTIGGWVTDMAKRDDIMRRAGRVDGVGTLVNAIGVLPASPADVALRMRVARAIYGNPLFWRYASSAAPPIHIVVSRGQVTLTGAVGDDTERGFAFALAHVAGAQAVRNELRVDKN